MSGPIRPPLTIETADGALSGRPINTIKVSNGDLSISGTTATIDTTGAGGGGTVTSITTAADTGTGTAITTSGTFTFTGGTNVTTAVTGTVVTINSTDQYVGTVTSVTSSDLFVNVATGTTTPVISIGSASAVATGVLTAANWSTFNGKQDSITLTTIGTSGAASLVGATLNVPEYGSGDGTVTSITTAADTGTGTAITTSGTFTFTGGTNVTTAVTGTVVTINSTDQYTGTVTGTGTANQVSYWTAASVQAGSTNLTFDGTNLQVGGYVESGTGKFTTDSGTTDLTLDTNNGTGSSGSIVIEAGGNGQISINPHGTGTVKIDGVEIDNSAISTGYVLKASSASAAGWAAESGGGGGAKPSIATSIDSAFDMYMLTSLPPFTRSVLSSTSQAITTTPFFTPFLAPTNLTGAALEINITGTGAASNLLMCLYEASTSTGNPTTKVTNSDVTIDATSTGYKTATFSSTISLTNNTVYWIGLCSNNNSITVRTHPSDNAPAVGLINGLNNFNRAILKDTVASGSLPATITDANLESVYGFTPFIGLQV